MAKVRKINVSEIDGRSPFDDVPGPILPNGTLVLYENNNVTPSEFSLRLHDGMSNGGKKVVLGGDSLTDLDLGSGTGVYIGSGDVLQVAGNGATSLINYSETEPIIIRPNANAIETPEEKTWRFQVDGGLQFPDGTEQTTAWAGGRVVNSPSFSTGAAGDRAGDLAFTNDYIYYCTADYTDGLSNIWKRVAWGGDTW